MKHKHKRKVSDYKQSSSAVKDLWSYFWQKPSRDCPKCGMATIQYYDPFIFSPVRTLTGRRRLKCLSCGFVWRPKKNQKSAWDKLTFKI